MQLGFGEFGKTTKLESFSKEELISKFSILEDEYLRAVREIYRLKYQDLTDDQLKMVMAEQLKYFRDEVFGAGSERYKKPEHSKKAPAPAKPSVKRPSERYPNIPVREVVIAIDPLPGCQACGKVMSDSGMTEDSEQLNVIAKKYEIIHTKRKKYRCQCQGCLITAPNPKRIIPGSSYSDEMIQDVSLSKYCDLIPMERYSAMAARSGLKDLPPQSLIELTHGFADFVSPVVDLIKRDVLMARVLHADETPHKMLEGSEKKSWYLWGFSTPEVCFLECHDTRSGDVASDVLMNSKCEVLVTDVYSGYGKAVRKVNESRLLKRQIPMENSYCNAHARRYFYRSRAAYREAEFYLEHYHKIYELNSQAKGQPEKVVLELRAHMAPHFEAMRARAIEEISSYSEKSKYGKALSYLTSNYDGLTLFLTDAVVPIDNNSQERLLRSHVVGRKTWYGTHSERGAKTAAVLFSIVETCKLNQVNPREYFENLVKDLLTGESPYTPSDFKDFPKS